MKYLDEYRDHRIARALAAEIVQRTTRPWVLMEICGGQTHTIMRYGIDELLPRGIELVHGPGCPVCVTPLETVDKAIALALRPDVILVSYGDMLRVPGSGSDLFRAKAQGADVRIAYSPMEAVKIARSNRDRKVWRLVSRPPLPPMRWLRGKPGAKVSATFPCWFRTCWSRRRSAP
jgi:hydrogenase expression/formation protein HypD